MNEHDTTIDAVGDGTADTAECPAGRITRFLRRQVHRRLGAMQEGRLWLRDPLGEASFGGTTGVEARVGVRDLSAYADIACGGTIGAAEAYMRGKWTASDLTALVRLFVANRAMMDGVEGGLARLAAPLQRLAHRRNRNTPGGSRRNIGAHYDLGNDFYGLFLDDTMCYSAGIFPHPGASLREASVHKLDTICRKLALGPDDHLLEIGTGWGGLALHAATHFGCRVTTTTISRRQHEYTLARVRDAGLSGRITVLDRDYRELQGQYDKLVSVEMIEAVGLEFLDDYFRVCGARLRPHGRMLIQGIVMADHLYEQARRSVDFIQKYIFPGGALPSLGAIQSCVVRMTDLQLVGLQEIGLHYARTLQQWRERFLAQRPAVRALGHGEEFIRMWEYYLAYCEGGFLERAIGTVQLVFDKPRCRLALPQNA
jgi:cyclopropane-fatty-acyl-phospholipid synthase